MAIGFKLILNKFSSTPKNIFILDGIGATLSAFLLGVILVRFEFVFGMPLTPLYVLASIAIMLATYSFSCYFLLTDNWNSAFMKVIVIANLLYCCLSIILVIYFFEELTIWGVIYFLLELLVTCGLIIIERWVYSKLNTEKL